MNTLEQVEAKADRIELVGGKITAFVGSKRFIVGTIVRDSLHLNEEGEKFLATDNGEIKKPAPPPHTAATISQTAEQVEAAEAAPAPAPQGLKPSKAK